MRGDFVIFCSEVLITINIQIPSIVFIVQNQALIGTAVQWQRETNPVMFGTNVTLTCMVGRKEGCNNTATRRWDIGPDRTILLLNGHSTNSSKYYEVSADPCENFSLVIMQFDLNDVNLEYWCSFGFETSRHMLMLDDRHFIGVPENKDITITLNLNEQLELYLNISFYKVYPTPTCKIKIGGKTWLDTTLVSNPMGIFFNSSLHYTTTIDKSQCKDNVITICRLLSYTILQSNTRLNCTAAVPNKEINVLNDNALIPLSLIIAVIMTLVMVFVMMTSLLIKRKSYIKSEFFFGYFGTNRNKTRWKHKPSLEETNVKILLQP